MEREKLFLNARYVPALEGKYTKYVNRNGVLKKVSNSPLLKRITTEKDIWYDLGELPEELQNKFHDMAITVSELQKKTKNFSPNSVLDSEEVLVYVKDSTLLLPIVGNLLPTDGTPAYTVVLKNESLLLKPIVVCWNCHWSELFTGQTEYENNVFCLVSDLTSDQRQEFLDDIITLGDVPEFLGMSDEIKTKKI